MYSDKENINILTAMLLAHSVRCAVVCPGSRNAAIVHNMHEAGMECHAVTDERSAAFYALGLSLARKQAVAICVTSGSAVLNTLPAVAEACYRHVPLVVISADRPGWAIGQLQGQTLPQPGVMAAFAGCSVDLPEVHDADTADYCQRLSNEALCEMTRHHDKPVHINVPISEPLFQFGTPELPKVRKIAVYTSDVCSLASPVIKNYLQAARRPLTVIGQCASGSIPPGEVELLSQFMPVLYEPLGAEGNNGFVDNALALIGNDSRYAPDLIFYVGDTIVSNKLKKYLRAAHDALTVAVTPDAGIHDVFGNLSAVVDDNAEHFLHSLCHEAELCSDTSKKEFAGLWADAIRQSRKSWRITCPTYTERYAVQAFEDAIACHHSKAVHYANSSAVRYAALHAEHYVYVNRGVNGIEGSLSTAAGFSLGTHLLTYCVIGDLSFFYDCNALWNSSLKSNLRILLLNNGFGKIFNTLPGLGTSSAFPEFVSGSHHASAQGICQSFHIDYRCATDLASLDQALQWLAHAESSRPLLLECLFQNDK